MRKIIIISMVLYASLCLANENSSVNSLTTSAPYQIHAVVISETMATISSPMAGLINRLLIKDGSTFKKDSVLAQFDCRTQIATLQKTTAEVKVAEVNRDSYSRLSNLGSASKMKVAESVAELDKAKAEQKIAQKQVSDCEVKAPFDGQITELYVHQNETVQLYQKLFDILDNNALVVKVLVPSDWIKWIKSGSTFELKIAETQHTYNIRVERIVNEVDAVSRSVKIIGEFIELPSDLKAGMSGDAIFKGPTQ